jgi:hypothetical protein
MQMAGSRQPRQAGFSVSQLLLALDSSHSRARSERLPPVHSERQQQVQADSLAPHPILQAHLEPPILHLAHPNLLLVLNLPPSNHSPSARTTPLRPRPHLERRQRLRILSAVRPPVVSDRLQTSRLEDLAVSPSSTVVTSQILIESRVR